MPIIPTVAGRLARFRTAVTHHRGAKRELERIGSPRSRHCLDW
jgi:hypothetical protein